MSWQRGPQAGFGIKASVLGACPTALCQKVESICDIRGYVVYDGVRGRAIGSGGNSHKAWEDAYGRLAREGRIENPYPWLKPATSAPAPESVAAEPNELEDVETGEAKTGKEEIDG
jgi:hypothetical protein